MIAFGCQNMNCLSLPGCATSCAPCARVTDLPIGQSNTQSYQLWVGTISTTRTLIGYLNGNNTFGLASSCGTKLAATDSLSSSEPLQIGQGYAGQILRVMIWSNVALK